MISAIEWIPVGRANPNPSKYEYSRAERDFLTQLVAARQHEGEGAGAGGGGAPTTKKDGGDDDTGSNNNDDEWEDVDDDEEEEEEEDEETGKNAAKTKTGKLPNVDPNSLPADLRMDEYSDDDDDDDENNDGDRVVGGLLGVGKDAKIMMGVAAFEGRDDDDDNIINDKKNDDDDDDDEFDDSDDDEDDDDLDDAPDTREYMPLDIEGLQSLGIGGTGGGGHKKEGGYTLEDLQNMTMNNANEDDEDEDNDDQEDVDDIQLRDTDALLVVAKTEEDFASLEINIFDTESSNLYVHHDIPLPSYPLCLALGCVVSSYDSINHNNTARAGNYVAVGSFEPGIEIWNLDVMNALEPTIVLGGVDTSGAEEDWMRMKQTIGQPSSTTIGGRNNKKQKSKSKKSGTGRGLREGSHTDAVMGLSWNNIHRQVLASASADCTVKLWDVAQTTHETYIRPSATLTHHTDKVQSLAWHPTEGTLLATGGYDRRVCLVDARSAVAVSTANNCPFNNNNPSSVKMVKLLADCEALAWDPHNQQYLTAASEDGTVVCYDVRKFNSDPVWSFVAHEYGGVSEIAYNNNIPGMFITCSIDKTVALWDTHQSSTSSSTAPQPCGSKEMSVGKLYSVSCYPSSPWLLACGGSGNELAIWDMEGEEAICNRFASRVIGGGNADVSKEETSGPEDFEAIIANDTDKATSKALESMNKSKKKKGKKKSKVHKR